MICGTRSSHLVGFARLLWRLARRWNRNPRDEAIGLPVGELGFTIAHHVVDQTFHRHIVREELAVKPANAPLGSSSEKALEERGPEALPLVRVEDHDGRLCRSLGVAQPVVPSCADDLGRGPGPLYNGTNREVIDAVNDGETPNLSVGERRFVAQEAPITGTRGEPSERFSHRFLIRRHDRTRIHLRAIGKPHELSVRLRVAMIGVYGPHLHTDRNRRGKDMIPGWRDSGSDLALLRRQQNPFGAIRDRIGASWATPSSLWKPRQLPARHVLFAQRKGLADGEERCRGRR